MKPKIYVALLALFTLDEPEQLHSKQAMPKRDWLNWKFPCGATATPLIYALRLRKDTALIGRDHVFDVYESIGSTSFLQDLQGLLNQVTDVLMVSLVVVNAITCVQVVVFEYVEYGQELSEMH